MVNVSTTSRPTRCAYRSGRVWTFAPRRYLQLALFLACAAFVWAVVSPKSQRCSNSTCAIGALASIATAQSLFREVDKDEDGEADYATSLEELGKCGGRSHLVDQVLASGIKDGYRFEIRRSTTAPDSCWIAYALPLDSSQDERAFVINHERVVYYQTAGSVVLINESTCAIPDGWMRVGS